MANHIITRRKNYFEAIGDYNYCGPEGLKGLPRIIAFDFESSGLNPKEKGAHTFCCQIGTGKDNYIVDFETVKFSEIRQYIQGKVLIGHNLTFDLGWFYVEHNFWPKEVGDTMIASMILHNGKGVMMNGKLVPWRHGFGYVMERELGLLYDKSEQKNINKIRLSTAKSIQYCFDDVDKLLDLHDDMVKKLQATDAIPTYKLHRRYIRALAYMEQCGLPVSTEKWKEKCRLDKIEMEEKERKVIDYIYETCPQYRDSQMDMFSTAKRVKIKLGSSQQMIPIFESYGINVDVPDEKDKTKTKKSIKADVVSKTKHPFVDIWLELQSIKHDISTYGENLLEKIVDEAFYTTFKPILDTARISTRREGINIMNFPKGKKTRSCFVAHPGYKILVSDYEGQETRTGADITDDEAMIDSIINDSCLHCAFVRVLNPELEELTDDQIKKEHGDKRQAAKSPRFVFQFGGAAYTLHQNEGVPLERAFEIEAAYRKLHHGIYTYGDKKIEEAINLGYIASTSGWRLYLPDYEDFIKAKKRIDSFDREFWQAYKVGKTEAKLKWAAEDNDEDYKIVNTHAYNLYRDNSKIVSQYFKKRAEYYKLCLNGPTQTCAAHQTKEAAARIFDYIVEHGHQWRARIAALQHDEVIMEVEECLVEEYIQVVEKAMKEGGDMYLTKGYFKMACECKAADDWYSAK